MGRPVKAQEAQMTWMALEAAPPGLCGFTRLHSPRPQWARARPPPQVTARATAGDIPRPGRGIPRGSYGKPPRG
jgi:hypothetical protein